MVLHRPNSSKDSDKDDAPSDYEESPANLRDIGGGILAEKGEIKPYSKADGEVLDIDKEVTPRATKKRTSHTKKTSCKLNNKPVQNMIEIPE